MKKLIALLLLVPALALAQVPLKSAAWEGSPIPCQTSPTAAGADLMPLKANLAWNTQLATPGAGNWPAGQNLTVRKVCVSHFGTFQYGYAVVGHSGVNGDHVSPYVNGQGTECMSFERDAPIVVTGGEYFDVHAGCNSGQHHVVLQLWYTQP